ERSTGGFREFDKVLPAVRIVTHLPHDTLHLFVIHKAVETAHAMAFDEGDHVVFDCAEVVRNGRHNSRETANFYCMPFEALPPPQPRLARRRSSHQLDELAIELSGVQIELNFHELRGRLESAVHGPGHGVAVTCSAVQIDGH